MEKWKRHCEETATRTPKSTPRLTSLIFVEASETELWQKVKWREQQQKNFVVRFWNFAKNKNFRPTGEQSAAARNDVTVKKLLTNFFRTFSGRPVPTWPLVPFFNASVWLDRASNPAYELQWRARSPLCTVLFYFCSENQRNDARQRLISDCETTSNTWTVLRNGFCFAVSKWLCLGYLLIFLVQGNARSLLLAN